MNKVKVILASHPADFEKQIEKFLESENVKVIEKHFSISTIAIPKQTAIAGKVEFGIHPQFMCVITYAVKEVLNKC